MGKQHNFLLRISRLLPSSFSSCLFKTLTPVVENSITFTKPKKILHENDLSPFLKKPLTDCKETLLLGNSFDAESRKPASVTHISKLNSNKKPRSRLNSSSNSRWFSSSDDEDDVGTDNLFSLSSNSGDPFSWKTRTDALKSTYTEKEHELGSDHISAKIYYSRNLEIGSPGRRKTVETRRKIKKRDSRWMMEESFVVVKSSFDPRSDFRESMLEMIVEKQMLGAQDLERLLICFLSLNEACNHRIIVDVFSEICEALFGN